MAPGDPAPAVVAAVRSSRLDITLAHDYLSQRGGAERVALEMTRAFPDAPLLTSVYEPAQTFPEFQQVDVRPTSLNRVRAWRREPRLAMPLIAPVISRVPACSGVLLCSSSGWAHGFRSLGPKIVYCHNPARWLYQPGDYFEVLGRAGPLAGASVRMLRPWDRRAAASATLYLANSSSVARRIHSSYGIEAEVLHPPAALDPDGPQEAVAGIEPGFFLTVGRRRSYKNTGLICTAVERTPGARLVVVGGLPGRPGGWPGRINGVEQVSDAQLRWLYANCAAVVAVGREDFGLTPVEGFRFGRPSIVLRAGGYLDSCVEGSTSIFVDDVDPASLAMALRRFDPRDFDSETVRSHGQRFSPRRFADALRSMVSRVAA